MRDGWNDPLGVSWPAAPVDTGQDQRSCPSTATVMCCVALSIVTRTSAEAAAGKTATAEMAARKRMGRRMVVSGWFKD